MKKASKSISSSCIMHSYYR